jgi:hypothetical protein
MATKTTTTPIQLPNPISKNAPYLWGFIGINLAVFLSLFVTRDFDGSSVEHLWKSVTAKDGIIAVCIPILTIVLNGFLDHNTKARLVFWRWRNPLPGCRVFSELIKKDPRVDVQALKKKHGRFPRNPQAQNALWYHWYKTHNHRAEVSEAGRIYLLTRDMTTVSAAFVSLFSIGLVIDSVSWKLLTLYTAILVAQYLILATASRNYGVRFVLNVLAEESHT